MRLTLSQQQAAPANPWTPAKLGADLLGFWDAENFASITQAAGLVSSWVDSTANAYAVVQATDANKPTYAAAGFNGRPALTFDGAATFLRMASTPFPLLALGSEIWGLASQNIPDANAATATLASYGAAAALIGNRRIARAVTAAVSKASCSAGTPMVDAGPVDYVGNHLVRFSVAPTQSILSVDGIANAPILNVPATTAANVTIGASGVAIPTQFWNGATNAIIVTNPLTDANAALLTAYLKNRGGIA